MTTNKHLHVSRETDSYSDSKYKPSDDNEVFDII